MSAKELTIGDGTRDGLFVIADTSWDSNGTLRVTVKEQIGQPWSAYPFDAIRKARRLARRALVEYYPGQTRSARTVRTFTAGGQSFVTFAVSRNEA